MQVTPYLFFPGTCREAMTRYAEILGAEPPEIMPYSAMPDDEKAQMGDLPGDAVMHAAIRIGSGMLMASDHVGPGFAPMAGASITVTLPSAKEARRVYEALAEGGTRSMPLEETFWSPAFGTLTDRWGTRWMVMAEETPG